jgi:hypothetical protein
MPKMNLNDFPQEPILVEERYPAVLKEVTEYEKDYGEGPVSKLAWVFEVTATEDSLDPDVQHEEEFTGTVDIAAHTSMATGPNSNYAKLNFPAFVGEGWDGDTDNLIGKEAVVDVTSYETKGGQIRNVIEKVRLPKGKAPKKAKSPGTAKDDVVIDESDFADIPV